MADQQIGHQADLLMNNACVQCMSEWGKPVTVRLMELYYQFTPSKKLKVPDKWIVNEIDLERVIGSNIAVGLARRKRCYHGYRALQSLGDLRTARPHAHLLCLSPQ
jgi:hypothetical protein